MSDHYHHTNTREITDQDLDATEGGVLVLRKRGVPVQLVQPNPYLNYDPHHDSSVFNIVDRDYGVRLRVSEKNGLYRKQYQFMLVMFAVSRDIDHPVQTLIHSVERAAARATDAIERSKRATIVFARCDVDRYPLVQRMLARTFDRDSRLLPILVLFEDNVARRPPVFRPMSVKIGDVPDHTAIERYINNVLDSKLDS